MPISLYLVWFLIGIGFLIAEMMVPGFILVFFAAGCWVVAITVFFLAELPLTTQVFIFIISSLILLFSLRRYGLNTFKGGSKGGVDDEFSQIGQKALVTKTITADAYGEIQLGGTFWQATANITIEQDQFVIVEGTDPNNGLIMQVKPLSKNTDTNL